MNTNHELLEEAKRRFPDGTTIRCVLSNRDNDTEVVRHATLRIHPDAITKAIDQAGGNCFMYYGKKWATVVSLPDNINSLNTDYDTY